jgi:hypothetical protein
MFRFGGKRATADVAIGTNEVCTRGHGVIGAMKRVVAIDDEPSVPTWDFHRAVISADQINHHVSTVPFVHLSSSGKNIRRITTIGPCDAKKEQLVIVAAQQVEQAYRAAVRQGEI